MEWWLVDKTNILEAILSGLNGNEAEMMATLLTIEHQVQSFPFSSYW